MALPASYRPFPFLTLCHNSGKGGFHAPVVLDLDNVHTTELEETTMLTSADHTATVTAWSPSRSLTAVRPAQSALDACFAQAQLRHLKAKEPLFAEGDTKSNAYKVESGAVVVFKILNDGFRQIVNFAFPGDYVGLEQSFLHTCDAQAIGATRIRSLPSAVLSRRAKEDNAISAELFSVVSRELSDARSHFLTIGRLNATGRIATFLLDLAQRNERKSIDAVNIDLPLRRSDIADFLCLSVETVSRSLTELKNASIISLRGWRMIKLADREALENLAGGEAADSRILLRKAA
jgi:CRP-like cAMP-binding protein